MENQEKLVTPLFEKIREYGETSYELIKLKTVEKIVRLFSGVVTRMIIITAFCLFLIFLSIALAICLGQICGEMYMGFAWVGLGYGFLGGVLVLFLKKRLKKGIADAMVKNIFN
jgi:hypothetical protein